MKAMIKISANFPVTAKRLYDSWLNSSAHTNFTGEKAEIDGRVGGKFKAWDGYISGSNLILQPYGRIVQNWRTKEFPDSAPDSRLEILFEKHNSGTKITLIHTQLPNGDERKYEKGWKEHYFKPMKKFFKKSKK
jgi:activator of HSP90 ATPase